MKKHLKKAAAAALASAVCLAACLPVGAAETYIPALMFDTQPGIDSVTAKYSTSLVDRGGGNQALKIVAGDGADSAMTMELQVPSQDFSGASYLEFFISVKGAAGETFEITPGLHADDNWIGMNTAAAVLFDEGLVGRYYVKPDGGNWELKEEGSKVTLNKGFSGLVRFPVECLTHNNVTGATNEPVKLNELSHISNWYSLLKPGDEIILDDFRFVKGDDSFFTPPTQAPTKAPTQAPEPKPTDSPKTEPDNPDPATQPEPGKTTSGDYDINDFFGDGDTTAAPTTTAAEEDAPSGGVNVPAIVFGALFVVSLGGNLFLVYRYIVAPRLKKEP
jgi:hypothetical protein